jgi:hypothetical protein
MRNNLLGDPAGFALVPPDATFQNQHVWVPREAVVAVEVLGVIGSPLRRVKATAKDGDRQLEMFGRGLRSRGARGVEDVSGFRRIRGRIVQGGHEDTSVPLMAQRCWQAPLGAHHSWPVNMTKLATVGDGGV